MIYSLKHVHFIMLVLLILTGLISCGNTTHDRNVIDLAGKWKIINSDSRDIPGPRYDDSKAETIDIPGNWNHIVQRSKDQTSIIWLRKKVYIKKDSGDGIFVLSLGTIGVADETYMNGVLVGGRGEIPSKNNMLEYGFAWQSYRNYYIPASIVRPGEDNTISIRIFSHIINGIKERPELISYKYWTQYLIYREYLPAIIIITPLLVTCILFLFFLIIIKSNVNPAIIFLGSLLVSVVTVIHFQLLGFPAMINGLARMKIILGLYLLADFVFVLLVQEFLTVRFRWPMIISVCLLVIAGGLVICVPGTTLFITFAATFTLSVILVYIVYSFTMFLVALFRDPRQYWYLTVLAIIILASAFMNIYFLITYQVYRMSLSSLYHVPLFFLGGMYVYIFDMKNAQRERDSLTTKLLQRTNKLHQLMKRVKNENVRPEPRETILTLIEYLDNNYSETYDRLALAKKFNLNEDYMGQVFRKYTGSNISNYLNCRRIDAAKQLLRDTETKIIDIAYHVGFDNLTYFYRLFKKKTGLSPNEFRSLLRGGHFKDDDALSEDELL